MAAGSIVIDLLMKTGSFVTDTDRAAKSMKKMKAEAEAMGKAVGVAFAAMGAAALVAGKQIVDGLDALNDMADATGSTVEKLSALEDIALRTGTSVDTVTTALVKFNSSLASAKPGSDIANALKAIGLNAAELKKLDPADALLETALALAKFADDGDKARLVQELFGKSIKEVGPLLKDLAEKGQLVATVTKEETTAAEDFNKQLASMRKNVTDLGRDIMGGLLPALNAWATVLKEGGILAFLGLGGGDVSNPGARLQEVNDKLAVLRQNVEGFAKAHPWAQMFSANDVVAWQAQIKLLEAEQKALKALQATQALGGGGDTSDALSRRMGRGLPGVGPLPATGGKDPDADFKQYLNNLQQQIQGTRELTAAEKLLDDIRRGSLTVSDGQKKQLEGLAREVDLTKEAVRISTERAALRRKDEEDSLRAMREIEEARQKRERDLLAPWTLQISESQQLMENFGQIGVNAFESLALSGAKFSDVLKDMLGNIARLIFQVGVAEPLMAQLRLAIGGGGGLPPNPYAVGTGGGIDWAGIASKVGSFFGAGLATGGDVVPGRAYTVGERGPETFVPRTFGSIAPSGAGAGGQPFQIINQTTGRVDSVQWDASRKAAILQETRRAMAADVGDPNSAISQALARHTTARRNH